MNYVQFKACETIIRKKLKFVQTYYLLDKLDPSNST
jgi:hypothetical protein